MTPPGGPRTAEALRIKNRLYSGDMGYTATYRYGDKLRAIVARSKAECNVTARLLWGAWDGEPCYSNPASIYRDLTGETQRRHTQRGHRSAFAW